MVFADAVIEFIADQQKWWSSCATAIAQFWEPFRRDVGKTGGIGKEKYNKEYICHRIAQRAQLIPVVPRRCVLQT